jgi:hypothetical protein
VATTAGRPRRQGFGGVSLRLRLALLSTALLGVTLRIFGVVVYVFLGETLRAEVDRSLVDRARVVRDGLAPGGPFRVDFSGVDAISGALVRIASPNGTVVVRSDSLGPYRLPVTRTALQDAQRGTSSFENVQLDGVDLRLFNGPLLAGNRLVGIIQVARPLGPSLADPTPEPPD